MTSPLKHEHFLIILLTIIFFSFTDATVSLAAEKIKIEAEVQKKIKLLEIDAAFMETEKSASQAGSLDEQEKLWTEFIAKYKKTGRQSTIQNAKDRLGSIIAARKKKERKKRRDRRRRRSK